MTEEYCRKVMEAISERKITTLYFVACGGSSVLMQPSKYLLDKLAQKLSADLYNAAEFLCLEPKKLGPDALVILCSQEGSTPETVDAALYAKEKGACTVSLAMKKGTALEQASDHFIEYGYYEICDPVDTSYGVMLQLTAALIDQVEGSHYYAALLKNLYALKEVVQVAKIGCQAEAQRFAELCQNDRMIYVLGSGPNYSQAYLFSKTYIMEMQWIDSIVVHSDEFFHGPFEAMERDSAVVILRGLGRPRIMDERAVEFCGKYSERMLVVDVDQYPIEVLDEAFRELLCPLIFNPVMREYSKAIAEKRKHPLETRRYMHLVDYEWRKPI